MVVKATDPTSKCLLIVSVFLVHIMTYLAFLRGVGALDLRCLHPSLLCIPLDLLGDVGQVGSTHIGINRACLELHGRDRELLIGKLDIRMLRKAFVDRPIDFLPYMPHEPLPTFTAGRGKLFDPLLFETG